MASDKGLTAYSGSAYADALKHFTPTGKKEPSFVYVEDVDDIPYWESILNSYGNQSLDYRVSTIRQLDCNAALGCVTLLKKAKDGLLGKKMFVCVDADLHLWVDGFNQYTDTVRSHSYVINTTYYAIENILVSDSYINALLGNLDIPHCKNSVNDLLSQLSLEFEDLFLLLLADLSCSNGTNFSMPDMNDCMAKYGKGIRTSLVAKYAALYAANSAQMATHRTNIIDSGYAPGQWWKIFRGHTVLDSIVVPFITRLVNDDIKDKLEEFKQNHHGDEIAREKERLYSRFGDFASLSHAITHLIYNNTNTTPWAPRETIEKIQSVTEIA